MSLNLNQLEKAILSLEEALEAYARSPFQADSSEKTLMRDGVIQRFEYTFELSWKTLKRYLEEYGLERVDTLTNKELFRLGGEAGLLREVEAWFVYLHRRNQTSHLYNEAIAQEVFGASEAFREDARFLLAQLREKTR